MNNNCLITKLKSSVTDENLPKFGEFKIKVLDAEKALDNTVIYCSGMTDVYGCTFNESHRITSINSDYITIFNKYNFSSVQISVNLTANSRCLEFNIDDFKYLKDQLNIIDLRYVNVNGGLESIAGSPTTKFIFAGIYSYDEQSHMSVTDYLCSIAPYIKELNVGNAGPMQNYFELTDFAKALIESGRTDVEDKVKINYGGMTINGAVLRIPSNGACYLTWTSSTFTIKDTNGDLHTYDLQGNPINN